MAFQQPGQKKRKSGSDRGRGGERGGAFEQEGSGGGTGGGASGTFQYVR